MCGVSNKTAALFIAFGMDEEGVNPTSVLPDECRSASPYTRFLLFFLVIL